jgi:hypothetical protein
VGRHLLVERRGDDVIGQKTGAAEYQVESHR